MHNHAILIDFETKPSILVAYRRIAVIFLSPYSTKKHHFCQLIQRLVEMHSLKLKTNFKCIITPNLLQTKASILVAYRRIAVIFLSPYSTKKHHFCQLIQRLVEMHSLKLKTNFKCIITPNLLQTKASILVVYCASPASFCIHILPKNIIYAN